MRGTNSRPACLSEDMKRYIPIIVKEFRMAGLGQTINPWPLDVHAVSEIPSDHANARHA